MRSLERRLSRLEALADQATAVPEIPFGPGDMLARLSDTSCPTCRVRSQILERALGGCTWRLEDRCPECGMPLDDALIVPTPSEDLRIVPGWYCAARGAVARDLGISPRLVPRKPELAASLATYWLGYVFRAEQRALEMLRDSIESRPPVSLVRDHGPLTGEPFDVVLDHHRRLREQLGRYFHRDAALWIDAEGYLCDGLFEQAYLTPSELARLAEELPDAAAELRASLAPPYSHRVDESLPQITLTVWSWRLPR